MEEGITGIPKEEGRETTGVTGIKFGGLVNGPVGGPYPE